MSIPTHKGGKLGKLKPVGHSDTLLFNSALSKAILPALPPSVAWESKVTSWNMLLNDQLGDCVEAAIGHTIMTMTSQASSIVIPTDNQIQDAYSGITGYVPGDPSTDNGTVMVEALAYWRNNGIANDKIVGWASVKIDSDLIEFRHAIALFGTVLVGFNFPQSAMDQFNYGQPWSIDMTSPLIGGHCVAVSEYDNQRLVCETWGALQPMTLGFLPYYADEAYVVITQDWIESNKRSPSGYNISVLTGDSKVLN